MRFVSKARAFKKGVIKAEQRTVENRQTGMVEVREVTQPYIAIFRQGGATAREVELARQRFAFKGLAEGENPLQRISVFDTDEEAKRHGWGDEFKTKVESILVGGQNSYYFLVENEKAAKPWPAYDEADAGTIIDSAGIVGVSLDVVLAYERENKNRKTVVKAIEEKLAEGQVVVEA